MKLSIANFYPAHSSNYTKSRTHAIDQITIHHSAGLESTLRYLWADPARNGSSHFFVHPSYIEQYVDTNDTAWTNGNWLSNTRSITIEVRGDWRNGYYDQATLNQLKKLLTELRKHWPSARLTYHMDESDSTTLCPADLKHKGYAKKQWDAAVPSKPTPTPVPSKITYRKITAKRVILVRPANLWDFNFTDWSKAKSVKAYPQGYVVDVVAVAKNALGGEYYMTAYSYNDGKVRATNGFNIKDAKDYVAPKPVPTPKPEPEPAPAWQPFDNPRSMRTAVDLKVYDLGAKADVGDVIHKNTDIALVDKITVGGKTYYRSKWAHDNNKNWGVDASKMVEIPTVPPVEEPPIDTNPEVPGSGDVVSKNVVIAFLESIVKLITDFVAGLRK